MSKERVIKYLRHPAFTAALLTSRNPYLQIGEVVYELNGSNLSKKFKVGPGLWNDLTYFQDDTYLLSTNVLNPIGDATGNMFGKTSREILELMLHPYQVPAFTSITNNAGGTYSNINTLEIGQTLSGTVGINYVISNGANLSPTTPINVTAGGIFSAEGAKAHSGNISMTLLNPLTPASVANYIVSLTATHTKGVTTAATTQFRFWPKLIWGTTALTNPTASDINTLSSKQTLLSNEYKKDYNFNSPGYCVVAIPAMLSPGSYIFTDVTDPNAPAGFSMENLGNMTVNNGVGTYLYTVLRSTYYITAPSSILRIS